MSGPWDGPILERGTELESADAALTAAARGEGSILPIEGPPGMGKSRLAEAIANQADSAGFGVHRARGEDLEARFAYGALRQMLRSMLDPLHPSDRAAVVDGPARLAAGLLDDVAEGTAGDALGIDYGFYRLLQDLAERRPRLLLLDDAHWADVRTLNALRFATRRLEEQSVVTVITYRPAQDGEQSDLLSRLSLVKSSRRLHLSPLGPTPLSKSPGLFWEPSPVSHSSVN